MPPRAPTRRSSTARSTRWPPWRVGSSIRSRRTHRRRTATRKPRARGPGRPSASEPPHDEPCRTEGQTKGRTIGLTLGLTPSLTLGLTPGLTLSPTLGLTPTVRRTGQRGPECRRNLMTILSHGVCFQAFTDGSPPGAGIEPYARHDTLVASPA